MPQLSQRQQQKLAQGREYRMTMEVRAAQNAAEESYIVEGYATTFNDLYALYTYGNYTLEERIDPHAFDECDMSDVIMQFDHTGRVYARTRNNTLTLRIDSKGLFIIADLGGTEEGRKLYQDIKGGYVDRMSFGFVVGEDRKEYTTDHETGHETCTRTILRINKLYDVSAVSIPANDMTIISARALFDGWIEGQAEEHRRAAARLNLKILLEE